MEHPPHYHGMANTYLPNTDAEAIELPSYSKPAVLPPTYQPPTSEDRTYHPTQWHERRTCDNFCHYCKYACILIIIFGIIAGIVYAIVSLVTQETVVHYETTWRFTNDTNATQLVDYRGGVLRVDYWDTNGTNETEQVVYKNGAAEIDFWDWNDPNKSVPDQDSLDRIEVVAHQLFG
ncbi:hypothetical protein BDW59DRAFT_164428 [Aspergillus cavernicola]|uniref:Uncharacterized protein n=1 Tax=Aspergillus cavernicola TaxID=176166 RepID=A0ABR4HZL8_9EURO